MEPRREEEKPEEPRIKEVPRPEEKRKRFRLIKLEERIAPSSGGGGTKGNHATCGFCTSEGGYSVE